MEYDDEYDYERDERRYRSRRRPSPPPRIYTETRRSQQYLNPGNLDGLYRTRSQGAGLQPVVNVYNDIVQEGNMRNNEPRAPSPLPYPQSAFPQYGRRDRLGDELADEFVDLTVENRRLRGRSRGRSDADSYNSSSRDDFLERELRRRDREIRELERSRERERDREREEERIRKEYQDKALIDEAKRKDEEARRKEERRRIIDDYKQQEWEDEQDRKAEEKRMRERIELEKIQAKEKEEREWAEFERKRKEKEEKAKAEKAAHDKEIEDEMRARLLANGYSLRQIEAMIDTDRVKRRTVTTTQTYSSNALDLWQPNQSPVYAKIHRSFLSVETLRYYGIPWKYDETDTEYIIILREMDKHQTEVLFEHTKRLRAGNLLIEPKKEKERELAFFKKKSRSKSRTRKFGILEFT